MVHYPSLSACNQRPTGRNALEGGKGESARGRWTIKNGWKQGQLQTWPVAMGTIHRYTRARLNTCVHVHDASRAPDSGRPVSRRLVATVSLSASQPRQPSYMSKFGSGDTPNQTGGTHRSSSRRSSSDSSGMVLLRIALRSESPLAQLYRSLSLTPGPFRTLSTTCTR